MGRLLGCWSLLHRDRGGRQGGHTELLQRTVEVPPAVTNDIRVDFLHRILGKVNLCAVRNLLEKFLGELLEIFEPPGIPQSVKVYDPVTCELAQDFNPPFSIVVDDHVVGAVFRTIAIAVYHFLISSFPVLGYLLYFTTN